MRDRDPVRRDRELRRDRRVGGRPRAHRAVGTACRYTPLTIVVPVHRVILASGALGGFSGNEEVKRFLLDLEGARVR